MQSGVASFYEGWSKANAHLVDRIGQLGADALELRAAPESWPVWAIVGHLAGTRVYWLCGVIGEAGAGSTPFSDPLGQGWEDRLDARRESHELITAVQSSWRIVESCLDRWTPAMLGETFTRELNGSVQLHTRQSVLTRLLTHDAYHSGEVSLILGTNGMEGIDLWRPLG
jgi:uncharacterized damage-inducible protein DinB